MSSTPPSSGTTAADAASPDEARARELSPRARAIAIVVWASFLAAGVGTMFFFAFIAPADLLAAGFAAGSVERMGVYTLGFFGLWLLAALASALSLYLARTLTGRSNDRHG